MKKMILVFSVVSVVMGVFALGSANAAAPIYTIETAPQSNVTDAVVTAATASVSAVTISSFTITRVDSAFNTAATTAMGAAYQRAEITVQNNDTTDKFCGYSSSALTISNSFKIAVGAVWSFKLGKGIPLYCLNAAGSSGTLIVGGVAWK